MKKVIFPILIVLCGCLPRVMNARARGEDQRYNTCRTLNDRMNLRKFASLRDWKQYRKWLGEHILVCTGLWPMPPKTPLRAKVFDTVHHEDYSVSKVYFESRPGFYVCGNLYEPVGKKGPFPGILNPHGHWKNGRFGLTKNGNVRARLISFARQGYVAFGWSMVGYNDADQIGHSFGDEVWGFSLMGLQLWNSIRACDFLSSRENVDKNRIGCTGASGGGTQTFMLCAIEPRIKVSAPVNMISAIMQGGCECENAPLLRLEANNVEIGSMMAPRPMLMVSATGDWTKNTLHLEYPAVKAVYELYGAGDKVQVVQFDAPHNYNLDSRNAVYKFFARWLLQAKDPDSFQEKPLTVDPVEKLLVFDKEHPRPANALDKDGLLACLIKESKQVFAKYYPRDKQSLQVFRQLYGTAYRHIMDARQPDLGRISLQHVVAESRWDGNQVKLWLFGRKNTGEQIKTIIYYPAKVTAQRPITIIVHPQGWRGLTEGDIEHPSALVRKLLGQNQCVVGLDCFHTGESAEKKRPRAPTHDLTYNRTDLAYRVQDILTIIGKVVPASSKVSLVGIGSAGLWALAACPLAQGIDICIVDVDRFDSSKYDSWKGDMLLPGLRRIGGLQTAAALSAPVRMFIHNTGDIFQAALIKDVYRLAGASGKLQILPDRLADKQLVDELLPD